jgi:hypothetical protein
VRPATAGWLMLGWLAGPQVPSTLGFMNAGPSLSLAEWTVLALIAEHPAHGFAISQLTAPGGELGRIWHIPRPVIYAQSAVSKRPGSSRRGPLSPAAGPSGPSIRLPRRDGRRPWTGWTHPCSMSATSARNC